MYIDLKENDIKNLKSFLNRLEYKGVTEAIAATNIFIALENPIKELPKKEK